MYNTGFGRSLRGGIAPQCCHRHVSLPARSGSCPPPRSGAASCGGYLSPPVRRGLWRVISILRIWVSSAFLRHSDETQILLKSQPQICAMGADGQHAVPSRPRFCWPGMLALDREAELLPTPSHQLSKLSYVAPLIDFQA